MGATSSEPRPWLVMVTGEPGSGKTSLGIRLSAALRVPFLSRDHIRGGLLATAGLWTDQLHDPPSREAAVDAFVAVVETLAVQGVTAVAEFVVTPQRVEAFRRIRRAANCVVILATARDAAARAEQRDRSDPLLRRRDVLRALGYESMDDYLRAPARDLIRTTMQTDFDLPLLHVTCADGYDPNIEAIVDWIIDHTRR